MGGGNQDLRVPAVRLLPYLHSHYSTHFLDSVCVLKTDTEGHDVVILGDLSQDFRPPVIWTEWYREYQFANINTHLLEVSREQTNLSEYTNNLQELDYCTEKSAQLFRTIIEKGLEIDQAFNIVKIFSLLRFLFYI